MMNSQKTWPSILLAVVSALLTYLVVEALYSALYATGVLREPTVWIYETSGKTRRFDPIRGYRLTSTPSRFARITYGITEYENSFSGNNQGFPDRNNMYAKRRDPETMRLAVFGDSFTAAEFLEKNWPDAVEDLQAQSGDSIELLNFSLSGIGLANWWSILMRLVEPGQYEIDGLLFAVYDGDLHRGFTISDHRGYQRTMIARLTSWNPEDWPKTLEEARTYLRSNHGYILSEHEYTDVLEGHSQPGLPRPWDFYAAKRILRLSERLTTRGPGAAVPLETFSPQQLRMIQDIARYAKERSLPVQVVHIPSRQGLLEGKGVPLNTHRFATLLEAQCLDGGAAFAGLSEAQIRAHWLPYDGHWAQPGSDRFAEFLLPLLEERFHTR